jgi:hypothetical protein
MSNSDGPRYAQLGLRNRQQAIGYALRQGVI